MPQLPQDQDFINLILDKHGVYVTAEDIREITLFHFQQNNKLKLSNQPINPVYNAKVLIIIGFAVLGFFLAPVLGVSAIVGVLIGAAIGFRFVGGLGSSKPNPTKTTPTYSFNSVPQLPQIGGVIPIIYTNRYYNLKGGVRVPGFLISTWIGNNLGAQTLYSLYALGYGEIGSVSEEDLLIDNQPRDNFFFNEVLTVSRTGSKNQQSLQNDYFPYYSQAISLTTSNTVGVSLRGHCVNDHPNSTQFQVSSTDYINFGASDQYRTYYGADFKIIAKDEPQTIDNNTRIQITANTVITLYNGDEIHAVYNTVYQTSKKCTVIDLNISTILWALDKNGGQMVHAMLFDLYVDNTRIMRFYDSNKIQQENHRFIRLKNLSFDKHKIELYSLQRAGGNLPILDINFDSADRNTIDSGVDVNGRRLYLELSGTYPHYRSDDDANANVKFDGKAQVSSDQAPVGRLVTVNEITLYTDLGHSRLTNYPGISLEAVIVQASNRVSSSPTPSHFIDRGRVGRQHAGCGYCSAGGSANVLNDIAANFVGLGVQQGWTLRNLDKRVESPINGVNTNQLSTVYNLNFDTGDRYLIYVLGYINNFPDIYVDILINYDGCLGNLLPDGMMGDFFIDYDSVIKSRYFCTQNNYFWDGVIDTSTQFVDWVNKESLASLLFPSRIGGKFGLIPEVYTDPVALFNNSNIIENTYVEKSSPQQTVNAVHVTYRDGSVDPTSPSKVFVSTTVTIMTNDVANGLTPIHPESLRYDSITNDYQAIVVGQMYLNTRLLQNKVIEFSTGLQGFGVREGSLIIVQHSTTEVGSEISGFVMTTQPFNNGSQRVTLSCPIPNNFPANYSVAIKRLSDGSVQSLLSFTPVSPTDIVINGLNQPLQPNGDNFTGDYVIIGKDLQHRRYFRVQSIEPQDNGSVKITGVLWIPEMFDFSNLTVLF